MLLRFAWIDAFTGSAATGNAAGVVLSEGAFPDAEWMQGFAAELGISEVAYLAPARSGTARFALRWFTPATEVRLCGHATLAGTAALDRWGMLDETSVTFDTLSGLLEASCTPIGYAVGLPIDPPRPISPPPDWHRLLPGAVVESWLRGTEDVVAVLAGPDEVREAEPDLAAIASLDDRALVVTAPGGVGETIDYVLRVFGPRVGIDEDPVTGSAQCVLGPHWSRVLGIDPLERPLRVRQLSSRGGLLTVAVGERFVRVGGEVSWMIDGTVDGPAPGTAGAP